MKKILFFIHDLGQGGAEKVLVNLVNNMDLTKFDISVVALFGGGVNEQFLKSDIRYKAIFSRMIPGNSHILKIFSPRFLHKCFIKEKYDIEIAYLEGPSARIVSGCPVRETKLVSWIHSKQSPIEVLAASFKNRREAKKCYETFDQVICVSEDIKKEFCSTLKYEGKCEVLYNTVESDEILEKSKETVEKNIDDKFEMIAVGTLKEIKGYDRLLKIIKRLIEENYNVHLSILGTGPMRERYETYIRENGLEDYVELLGYRKNPYKYVSRAKLFVCSSYSEGFSTAVTEALIVGTPVCTVDVSGMRELLGENSEYGIITLNDEYALYQAIKDLIGDSNKLDYYKEKASERGKKFDTEDTVRAVETMLEFLK